MILVTYKRVWFPEKDILRFCFCLLKTRLLHCWPVITHLPSPSPSPDTGGTGWDLILAGLLGVAYVIEGVADTGVRDPDRGLEWYPLPAYVVSDSA